MRSARVEYFPEADQELDDAFEWYLERSARAAEAFLREVERALEIITSAPQVWPRFESGTRKYVLRNFPYNMISGPPQTPSSILVSAAG